MFILDLPNSFLIYFVITETSCTFVLRSCDYRMGHNSFVDVFFCVHAFLGEFMWIISFFMDHKSSYDEGKENWVSPIAFQSVLGSTLLFVSTINVVLIEIG